MNHNSSRDLPALYCLCPQCARAVPLRSGERYCVNDGEPMLVACPACGAGITSPYARFCGKCGAALVRGPGPRDFLALVAEARHEP